MAEQMGYDTGSDEIFAIVALIIVMALIEVVLLAGPAFAVGARRHARTLALIAASGGTPAQSRRVILGSGVVLGLVASGIGLVLGIIAGWALLPVVQRFQGEWFGPFELPWLHLAAIVAFGLLSAVLASVVPAWLASRQDVVAVLAGRRGDRSPRASTPVVGLVLLGVGIAASAYGAVTSDSGNGALWIAASAVVSVLGMILVVPVVVSAVARVSGRLPLTARYAARDAARHRTRTVPAVAAVAATVAGVVALGIANASDERQNEMTYTPQAQMGAGFVSWGPDLLPGEELPDAADDLDAARGGRSRAPPRVSRSTAVQGLDDAYDPSGYTTTYIEPPRELQDTCCLTVYGPTVAVDRHGRGPRDHAGRPPTSSTTPWRRAARSSSPAPSRAGPTATIRRETWRPNSDEPDVETDARRAGAAGARGRPTDSAPAPTGAILPTALADELGLDVVDGQPAPDR